MRRISVLRVGTLLSLAAGLVCGATVWAQGMSIKTSPGKPARLDKSKGSEADSMEQVRTRLSDKLGAQTTDESGGLKISARASAAPEGGVRAGKSHGVARVAPALSWAYSGPGRPDRWGQLKPEYARCATGQRQSPIDIRDGIAVNLDPIDFDYKSSAFSVVDTGRTIAVNVAPGNFIEVMGRRYQLQRFDFQHPAEERIQGRSFAMGVHLTHKDEQGRLAVVAVLFERGGNEQPAVQQVWNNLPLERGEELTAQAGLDPTSLLPSDRRYYTYMGSLTTPPCQEGVLWLVMKEPVVISADQLAILARLYPHNARPVQPIAGRLIKGPR